MRVLKPKKGRLLIAEPSILDDSSFNRAIILLTEHNEETSIGFILNRPLKIIFKDIIQDIDCSHTIYQGGPVEQDNLYFVHRVPNLIPDSLPIGNGIYWGGSFGVLKNLLNENTIKKDDIRFFLGYSGWGKQQLESEITDKTWFVSKNDFNNIFSVDDESLWKNKLLQKGGKYKIWANAPYDIHLN